MRLTGRNGILAVAIAALLATSFATDAEARRKSSRGKAKASVSRVAKESDNGSDMAGGRYAAYVIDGNTGKVLFDRNSDAPRHPASLTKMMTLYLLFEDIERGKVKLSTEFDVSARASGQAPSKLGLHPGDTIDAEDAIKALVTRSANDVAVVIAENLAGSESAFAERMTRTARKIGMSGSSFYNASGLPDDRQITTAHDMVVLGAALNERFPTYFRYFSTRSFAYRGEVIGNHNRLLGRIDGIDGIKTGYTRASGFNLVSSLHRDGKHLIAAVMGGPSAGARDRHMASLLETNLAEASANGKRTLVAMQPKPDVPRTALTPPVKIADEPPVKSSVEKGAAVAMARAVLQPDHGQGNTPLVILPKSAGAVPTVASLAPLPAAVPQELQPSAAAAASLVSRAGQKRAGDDPKVASLADARISMKDVKALPELKAADETTAAIKPRKVQTSKIVSGEDDEAASDKPAKAADKAAPAGGWVIQLVATNKEADAKALLSKAQSQVALLKTASPYTESVAKGSETLYRARFSGFADQDKANAACSSLRKQSFTCLAMKR